MLLEAILFNTLRTTLPIKTFKSNLNTISRSLPYSKHIYKLLISFVRAANQRFYGLILRLILDSTLPVVAIATTFLKERGLIDEDLAELVYK